MDKNLLIEVLRNCATRSDVDAQQLIALKKQFPFSQTLQVISAKVSKDHQLPSYQIELQQAAVYSTDRAVLKEIMTMEFAVQSQSVPVAELKSVSEKNSETKEVKVDDQQANAPEKLVVYKQIEQTIDSVDVADIIIHDLKRLNELKHNFEMLFADQSKVSIPVSLNQAVEGDGAVENVKSRRARIIELAKSMNSSPQTETTSGLRKRRKEQSDIIEEIKTSKEEIEPGNERLKEQIEIIDQFIKTQPSITNVRDRNPLPPTDLNAIKSGEFGENIVSETLVEILIKQGKKDRAIEVLKKLIWKYPQKKAYFASQIEDLKK